MKFRASASTGGKFAGSVFGLGFFLMGSLFTYFVAREAYSAARTYSWTTVPCVIVASAVAEHPDAAEASEAFVFTVRYRYLFGGEEREADRFKPGYRGSADAGEAFRLAERYREGARTECHVDPRNPSSAALRRPSLWIGLMVLFPLLFVAVGFGVLFFLWRPTREREKGFASNLQAISQRARKGTGTGCVVAFFSLFLLVGLGILFVTTLRPAAQILEARSWRETPCRVVASQVRSHEGDDSTTYSVDILYAYERGGKEYRSNRYQFLGGSSGGYDGKAAIVSRLPPGTETLCWVNPHDPTEAVLVRGFTKAHLIGLVPLLFVLAGGAGVLFTLRAARRKAAAAPGATWLPAGPSRAGATAAFATGPVALRPKATPFGKLVGIILVAAFWNGIVSVFVWQAVREWRAGNPNWFLMLFLVPFLLIGLLMIVGIVYQFLALFNPRPYLTVGSSSLNLGGETSLNWKFTGLVGRIDRLRIFLEGREEATYRRGTTSYTDREVFATIPIADTSGSVNVSAGSATIRVPEGTMHSFDAPHNKIVWRLKVKGEIRSWPDVDEELDVVVRPGAAPAARTS